MTRGGEVAEQRKHRASPGCSCDSLVLSACARLSTKPGDLALVCGLWLVVGGHTSAGAPRLACEPLLPSAKRRVWLAFGLSILLVPVLVLTLDGILAKVSSPACPVCYCPFSSACYASQVLVVAAGPFMESLCAGPHSMDG